MGFDLPPDEESTNGTGNGEQKYTVYEVDDRSGSIIVAVGNSPEEALKRLEAIRPYHEAA